MIGRIALTGASGLAGRHIRAALSSAGYSVAAASRTRPLDLKETDTWQRWDLTEWREPSQLDDIFPSATALVHAGAAVPAPGIDIDEREILDANVRSCLCLGQWALSRSIPVLFISGAVVYRTPARARIPETAETGIAPDGSCYVLSKLLGEQVFMHLAGRGLRLTVLRATSLYGTGMSESKMIPGFLAVCRRGGEILLQEPIADRVNLLHAADLAAGVVSALKHGAAGIFNIAGPDCPTILEIAETCTAVVDAGKIVVTSNCSRPPQTLFAVDYTKAKDILGYTPRVTLREGLRRMSTGSL